MYAPSARVRTGKQFMSHGFAVFDCSVDTEPGNSPKASRQPRILAKWVHRGKLRRCTVAWRAENTGCASGGWLIDAVSCPCRWALSSVLSQPGGLNVICAPFTPHRIHTT
jgi:hypothetical protein